MPYISTEAFRKARDFLFEHRDDYQAAHRDFRWPAFDEFNWAVDWFDVIAKQNRAVGLRVFSDDGERDARTFAELSELSSRVANSLTGLGVQRGDRILVMLGNRVELWETMLAAMKIGAVVIPATSQLNASDLADRFSRGAVKHVVTDPSCTAKFGDFAGGYTRIAVDSSGSTEKGWRPF